MAHAQFYRNTLLLPYQFFYHHALLRTQVQVVNPRSGQLKAMKAAFPLSELSSLSIVKGGSVKLDAFRRAHLHPAIGGGVGEYLQAGGYRIRS